MSHGPPFRAHLASLPCVLLGFSSRWAGTLVEWVGWIGIAGIFLGSATFLEAGIGHLGRVLYRCDHPDEA